MSTNTKKQAVPKQGIRRLTPDELRTVRGGQYYGYGHYGYGHNGYGYNRYGYGRRY